MPSGRSSFAAQLPRSLDQQSAGDVRPGDRFELLLRFRWSVRTSEMNSMSARCPIAKRQGAIRNRPSLTRHPPTPCVPLSMPVTSGRGLARHSPGGPAVTRCALTVTSGAAWPSALGHPRSCRHDELPGAGETRRFWGSVIVCARLDNGIWSCCYHQGSCDEADGARCELFWTAQYQGENQSEMTSLHSLSRLWCE